MTDTDEIREAVAKLRQFLRSRWEGKDERLFLTGETAKPPRAAAPPRSGNASPARAEPAKAPLAARPPSPIHPRPEAAPAATAPATRTGAPGRHPSGILDPESSEKGRALLALHDRIKDCRRCPLGKTRISFVFGTGSPVAPVIFVGEAPGEQEDKQGLPFVGPAGQLLTRMLEAIGISRNDVFIGNVLKCRPPNNRTPQPEEVEECGPHLFEQIGIIRPKVVVALGAPAAQTLLKTSSTIGKLRGRWFKLGDADFFATYHPSAGLRAGDYKKIIEKDLQTLKDYLTR